MSSSPNHTKMLKQKTYRSKDYLQFIRRQPCLNCGSDYCQGCHAHHEGLGKRGLSIKPPDTQAVPLCPDCHAMRHQKGSETFWQKRDIKLAIIGYLTLYLQNERT
jgi:hypothetical protein